MNRKVILMSSVSTFALAAVAAAHAADAPLGTVEAAAIPDGFTISVEGSALFGVNTLAEDKLGAAPSDVDVNIQDNLGYRAAISLGKSIDPSWDVRLTGAVNQQMTSNSDFYYGSGFSGPYDYTQGLLDTDFDYETLDFEVGYRPTLSDNFDVRLFGGVRGLHYKDTVDMYVGAGYGSGPDKVGYGVDYSTEFLGAGPRVGVEGSTRFGDTMFGVSGLLAGSAIFGTARTDGEAHAFSGGSTADIPFPTTEESVTVYSLEASLGLDLHIDEAAVLTAGYRAEGLFGADSFLYSGGSGGESEGRWTHGPTLKLTGYFD